ncbi:hypothetical protein FHX48_000511 [Microbacterium halimionae]|uniref:Glycoside hydrolase 35 catalytic domain-containing protein n=1 Tax=Microbacterium halimionae TaxID=1526413 RepID=A0A7W3PL34_9MICO|nr:beta-galactosidase [Microbacterium halimionae]MBA8815459.1 hypothetical protein [Microbacterium halimionae]NII95506.1 hypothetical protein [Microbacterium halimionae]
MITRTRVQAWDAPETMPGMADPGADPRIAVTSRCVSRDGRGWIPASGEIHYSRVDRERWRERLLLMRAGGIDVISTYVIWIHHETERGESSFSGNLDIAAFVELCAELDLPVIVRIGPWVHGEVRNGGLPDWVQGANVRHRTNDPDYLAMVREWFAKLGAELSPLCTATGSIIGIQIENELYDQPEHLRTLKQMAIESGMTAPIYTATAWGGADLPGNEFVPLYSGYGDGFWTDAAAPWDATFRQHFFFSDQWDDPGVGADVRDVAHSGVAPDVIATLPRNEAFPPATCELGGGMATTYHRRVVPSGADIAAVTNAKLGSGSMWQGYYMYAGGMNPAANLQESHSTAYPNDLPQFDYDFHAALGSAGDLASSHAPLRQQHAFLAAFGEQLTDMPASFPDQLPADLDDATTPRWAVRAHGGRGFIFINWHQPHIPLPDLPDVEFVVETSAGAVTPGDGEIAIAAGTIARWPFGLEVGGVPIRWATGSVLTLLDENDDDAMLVLMADGRDRDVLIATGGTTSTVHRVDAERGGRIVIEDGDSRAAVLVLGVQDAARAWVFEGATRRLVLSDEPVWIDQEQIVCRSAKLPRVREWLGDGWHDLSLEADAIGAGERGVSATVVAGGRKPRATYGAYNGRASAPGASSIAEGARVFQLGDVGLEQPGLRRVLRVSWAGDIAELAVDGVVVADRFWDGTPWSVDLDSLAGAEGSDVTLRVLALHPGASVRLPARAEDRRRSSSGALLALDSVVLATSTLWS